MPPHNKTSSDRRSAQSPTAYFETRDDTGPYFF